MIDRNLYRETFSRLRASGEAKQEVLRKVKTMREKKRLPKLLRTAVIAAAMCGALAVTAGAVNVATDGALFRQFTIVWTGEHELTATDDQGNEVYITVADRGPVWEEDGRVFVTGGDGEAVDITERLAESGSFHAARDMTVVHEDGSEEIRTVTIDVTGTPEDWTAVQDNGDGSCITITSHDSEEAAPAGTAPAREAPAAG